MSSNDLIRVYVGADRSQKLAIDVLEYSIKRHTSAKVEVIPMLDLPVPIPKDPRNSQRTGFSFSRFCIPELAGYKGRAIYMDADMQVFKDIRDLWELPFDGAKVLVQESVKHVEQSLKKDNAPAVRKKQCAVMLLDCERLDWDIKKIVDGLDKGEYSYDQLLSEICILPESEVAYRVPFEWNSIEHFDENTCLIHYTDMGTQPWVSTRNPNGNIWFSEVRRMIADGKLDWSALEQEVLLGYFRPSILREIRYGGLVPKFLKSIFSIKNEAFDKLKNYVPHKTVYEQKRMRNKAIKKHEEALSKISQEAGL